MEAIIDPKVDDYCRVHTSPPSDVCAELASYTEKNIDWAQMLVGELVGGFLGFLARSHQCRRVLEIGCYTGYSALAIAEQLPEGGELITLDVDEATTEIARSYWQKSPHGKKVKAIVAPALDTLTNLEGPFDMVFIDADKSNYVNYLDAVLPMLSQRGIVIADNCLWSGRVADPTENGTDTNALREFNEYVRNHAQLQCVLVPIRDGMMLIQKRI